MAKTIVGLVLGGCCFLIVAAQLDAGYSSPKWASQLAQPSIVPILVTAVQVNTDRPTVTFGLQNTSAKAITAWHVSIAVGNQTSGRGVDAYRSFAGLTKDRSHLAPGGTITVTANLPSQVLESSVTPVITPTCAVFEDKSYAGDGKFADFVFQQRAAELAAWQQVTAALEKARTASAVNLSTLEGLLSTMDGLPASERATIVRQNARTNLSLAITAVRAGRSSAGPKLDSLLNNAHRNLAAAAAHSQ
jgi:hypothetical protein